MVCHAYRPHFDTLLKLCYKIQEMEMAQIPRRFTEEFESISPPRPKSNARPPYISFGTAFTLYTRMIYERINLNFVPMGWAGPCPLKGALSRGHGLMSLRIGGGPSPGS